jgi:hypothetical protein
MPKPLDLREYLTEQIELLTAMRDGEKYPAVRDQYAAELATVQHQLDQLGQLTATTTGDDQ